MIVEGLLLVKIASGPQTEFYWLPLPEFNNEFLSGHTFTGIIPVRTSLAPSAAPTPVTRPTVPEAVQKMNKRPVAVVDRTEITVGCGQEFALDGSKSSDPEGQPLTCNWASTRGGINPEHSWQPILKAKAPDRPFECEYIFYVIDGIRCSEPVTVKIHVVKDAK
jgi:hypothetical protein